MIGNVVLEIGYIRWVDPGPKLCKRILRGSASHYLCKVELESGIDETMSSSTLTEKGGGDYLEGIKLLALKTAEPFLW